MTVLFIDIGNSRSKFVCKDNKGLRHLLSVENTFWYQKCSGRLDQSLPSQVTAVYVACVAGKEIEALVMTLIKSCYKVIPVFLKVEQNCFQLNTHYEPFYTLGIDRWLNLLGAEQYYENFTVFDLGSAITVDTVIDHTHIGGLITPGLSLLQKAVLDNTAIEYKIDDLQVTQLPSEESFLATNTQDAILAGSVVMIVSYVNHMMSELRQQYGVSHPFVITGGDAKKVYPMLNYECELEPLLIFLGMDRLVTNL